MFLLKMKACMSPVEPSAFSVTVTPSYFRSVGTGDRSMHVSPRLHDWLWSRIFSCPRGTQTWEKTPAAISSEEYHPGSCRWKRDSANVCGQMEQRQFSAGCPHDSGSDLQIPSWVMLMEDGCVWMSVLLRRGHVSSWILRGPFVSWMLFSSSVPIT